ncbi:MAG: tyrosine-type recombinase/integrase [Anaeroplasma sp.]
MKYGIWLDDWFRNYIQPTSKIKTCERYYEIIEKHLKIKLGEYELEELTPFVLQRYVTELMCSGNIITGKGLAANSVNGIITVIQSSLKLAYTLGEFKEYNADKIKRPRSNEKKISCYTLIEQKKIEEEVLKSKKPKLFGIVLCLYSGLRIGELLALEWSDIDFKNGMILVNKTCHDGRDENGKLCRITGTPKTVSSKRIIPIPKQLISLLKEYEKKRNSKYVISDDGHCIMVRSYQKSFELLQKRIGIERKGFHALRHTFATRALECGMDVKTLSEILGHKNAAITLNRYTHSMMEHKIEMMNKLGKIF